MSVDKQAVKSVKQKGTLRVLKALREHGSLPLAALAKQAGLSRAALAGLVEGLQRDGLLAATLASSPSSPASPSTGSTALDLEPTSNYVLAIDIGGTKIRAALADMRGKLLAETVAPSVRYNGLEKNRAPYGATFAALRDDLLGQTGVDPVRLRACGVSVAGTVDPARGDVLLAPNLSEREFALGSILEDALATHVLIDNDVNLAAVGEHWKGAARGCKHFIFVAVGTGIGAGVFVDGRLYRGAHNAAGETGYMYVHGMEEIGPDGLGALEKRASGPGIAMAATRALAGNPAVSLLARRGAEITSDEVWAAASAGDALASRVIADTLDTLSLAVANMAFLLDPELIVLGGGVSLAGDALLVPVRERLSALLTPPITPRVEPSHLGTAAQLYGAAYIALDYIDNTIAAERGA